MKVIMNLKREIRGASLQWVLLCIGFTMIAGVLSPLICGNLRYFYCLELPGFCLSPSAFVLSWCVSLALIGFSAGIVTGNSDRCRKKWRRRGIALYVFMMILVALWYPVFFLMNSMILSVMTAIAILLLSFFIMRTYVKVSLISGFIMLLYQLWVIYCLILNFCIIIIN